jgi:hypothetical protein
MIYQAADSEFNNNRMESVAVAPSEPSSAMINADAAIAASIPLLKKANFSRF